MPGDAIQRRIARESEDLDLIMAVSGMRAIAALIEESGGDGMACADIRFGDVTLSLRGVGFFDDPAERLGEIWGAAKSISSLTAIPIETVARKILKVDGWTFNVRTVKAPVWMVPFREHGWDALPSGWEWLSDVASR